MNAHLTIGILNGDDIGHEVVPAAVAVAKAAAARHGLDIDWRPMPIGRRALDTHGSTMPDGTLETLASVRRLRSSGRSAIGPIRRCRAPSTRTRSCASTSTCSPTCGRRAPIPDIGCIYDDVDLIIVRENNEGFQPDRNVVAGSGEFRPNDDMTISVRVISRVGSRKVARAALELAAARRKRCTLVHKNTVFKLGCGMFVEECYKAAEEYPGRRRRRGHRRHHRHAPGARPAELRRRSSPPTCSATS